LYESVPSNEVGWWERREEEYGRHVSILCLFPLKRHNLHILPLIVIAAIAVGTSPHLHRHLSNVAESPLWKSKSKLPQIMRNFITTQAVLSSYHF
jgi:cell division protein FtsL